jgi:hypothetical protein
MPGSRGAAIPLSSFLFFLIQPIFRKLIPAAVMLRVLGF